jgi:predicted DNA-binding transcriptional regulator YafY
MIRTERLLATLQILREQRQPVTAAQIAERFAISERTAYRDIATLTSREATIVGEAGIGFVLRGDFFIPPLAFDADKAAALMLGLRFVLRRGDADLPGAAGRAFTKLAAVLPARFDDEAAMRSALVVAPSPAIRSDMLAAIRAAIDRRDTKALAKWMITSRNGSARISNEGPHFT